MFVPSSSIVLNRHKLVISFTKAAPAFFIKWSGEYFLKWLCIEINLFLRKWFEPGSSIPWLKKIIWVIGVLRRTVVSDWRFDNLCGSHLQSQVVVLVSWKFKNPGERFDWSIDRVAVGKYVMWLAVKTCAEIGYANRWIVKWIINKVLLFPVE